MSEPRTDGPFYVAGGTLRPGTPSYIARRADAELHERLLAGDFCYVLTARQMGKSSLMASAAKQLEEEGVRTAVVDLTQIGTERGAAEANAWYFGVAHEIHRRLGIKQLLRPWWQERADLPALQRLTGFFRELVLAHSAGKVVVFVDEIDSTIGLPFADDFFAAIRACFNARATDSAFERLTFVLLGVASPDQLIRDPTRTPFNIGHRIELTDFTLEEARSLAAGLHVDAESGARLLERVFYWTAGHPYLTQSLCRAVEEKSAEGASPEAIVDPLVDDLFLSSRSRREEANLKHARTRLTAEGRRLLQLYLSIRRGQKVPDEPASPLFAQLKLSGVVKVGADGDLVVRNRIYEDVFTPQWAKSEMPADRGYQLAAALLAAVLIGVLLYYGIFYPRIYVRQIRIATESDDCGVAAQTGDKLQSVPFWESRAGELVAQCWDHRALLRASLGNRDESLLSWLKAIEVKDTPRRRKEAQALVEDDYAQLRQTFRSPGPIDALAFSVDSRYILTASLDGEIRTWRREAGRPLRTTSVIPRRPDSGRFWVVQFGADGKTLFSLDPSRGAQKLDLATNRLDSWTLPSYSNLRSPFSGDGRYIVIADPQFNGQEFGLHHRAWDLKAGRPFGGRIERFSDLGFAFSPDGKTVALANFGNVEIEDLATGRSKPFLDNQQGAVTSLAFSPDGGLLLAGDEHGDARAWKVKAQEPAGPLLRHGEAVTSVAYSRDGRMILTGGQDNVARLWESLDGQPQDLSLQKGKIETREFHLSPPSVESDQGSSLDLGGQKRLVVLPGGWVRLSLAERPFSERFKLGGRVRDAILLPGGRTFLVATDHWLYRFSLDGKAVREESARLLRGTWGGAYRFVPRCDDCLDVVQNYSDSYFVQTIHLDEPDDPPIEGIPKELLAKWQRVLGLQFDKDMNLFYEN